MKKQLKISIGQSSSKGIKEQNEDSYGVLCPSGHTLDSKGITAIIADGMGSCEHPKEASDNCVNGFINDYYSTPDSWTVRTSAAKVLTALNSWLYSKGIDYHATAYVSTFSGLILKSTTAHILHIGDSRIYRYQDNTFEQITTDHRLWISNDKNYLSRAVGIDLHLDIDYKKLPVKKGDIFIMTTDGIHDYIKDKDLKQFFTSDDEINNSLDQIAKNIVSKALDNKSHDNVSCQIIKVDELPEQSANEVFNDLLKLPFPPELEPGMIIDGYRVVDEINSSSTSQLYVVEDCITEESSNTPNKTVPSKRMVMKTPSINFEDDPSYLEQFYIEEWAGKRLNHKNLLMTYEQSYHKRHKKNYLYFLIEHIKGKTLAQWIEDNPQPDIKVVVSLVEQIISGIRAIHRMEMLHRDLKPDNIMITDEGEVKIIDFGSIKIAGVEEISTPVKHKELMGTMNYTAPEYIQGIIASPKSDLFSLGVIVYEMLTSKHPYTEQLTKQAQSKNRVKLDYIPSIVHNPMIPLWIDGALKKAVNEDPRQRYDSFSEFLQDLKNPNEKFCVKNLPLLERSPVKTWQVISAILLASNLVLVYFLVV